MGALVGREDVGADDAGKSANTDLDGDTCGTLRLAANVLGEEGNDTGETGVGTDGSDEASSVADASVVRGETDAPSDGRDTTAKAEEEGSVLELVGEVGEDEHTHSGDDVDWDSHQLGVDGIVTEGGLEDSG